MHTRQPLVHLWYLSGAPLVHGARQRRAAQGDPIHVGATPGYRPGLIVAPRGTLKMVNVRGALPNGYNVNALVGLTRALGGYVAFAADKAAFIAWRLDLS
jgi:hypothetical protein